MAKKFKALQAKMTPEARARSEAKAQHMIQEMALDELREEKNQPLGMSRAQGR
jgi:hypothetical protein